MEGFPSAVLRLKFATDGSLYVGMSNRGWSSLGNKAYGLQKVGYTGEVPLAIKEMRAVPGGFEVEFTQPPPTPVEFSLLSFTYNYASSYGGPEIHRKSHNVGVYRVQDKPNTYALEVDGLRGMYVYELRAKLPSAKDLQAYYTLNSVIK